MPETYGERLAAELERAELRTLKDQAEAIGIPERTLQDILADKVEKPQLKTRRKIDAWLGARLEGETAGEWPKDLRVFLDILGAYLFNLPSEDRQAFIDRTVASLARRDYAP